MSPTRCQTRTRLYRNGRLELEGFPVADIDVIRRNRHADDQGSESIAPCRTMEVTRLSSRTVVDTAREIRLIGPRILDDRQLSGAELGDLGPCCRKRAVSKRCRAAAAAATSVAVCQAPRRIEIMRAG